MNDARSELMARAIELSRRGFPAPNPRVGCVVAQGSEIVGEGWHDHAGWPHAERVALGDAGPRAKGADLYCTLEPCNHHGRTPPCTEAIIEAGIARVFVATHDPNPIASGGCQALQAAGIACEGGLLEEAAAVVNALFLTAMKRGRPVVVVKSATTSDGFIARSDGQSKWITGEKAREAGHRLRAEMGCVLVGRATVELDDPQLTARIPGVVNQPLRAVLDPRSRLSDRYKVFSDGGETVRFVREASRQHDVEIPVSQDGFVLDQVLAHLWGRGVIGVLVEGGGETAASFLRSGLVDRIERFTSPQKFGTGRPWLGATAPSVRLKKIAEERLDEDLHETFRVLKEH